MSSTLPPPPYASHPPIVAVDFAKSTLLSSFTNLSECVCLRFPAAALQPAAANATEHIVSSTSPPSSVAGVRVPSRPLPPGTCPPHGEKLHVALRRLLELL
nr:unnamed protein product [Digitaria exilis]